MARILLVSIALVLSGSIAVYPLSASRGLSWWSWSQGKPPWTYNSPQLISLRNSILHICVGVGCSKSVFACCVWCLRSVFGIYSVRNWVSAPAVGVGATNWILLVVDGYCLTARSFSCKRSVWVFYVTVWASFRILSICESPFPHPQPLIFCTPMSNSTMAPRRRGIPRRGSNSGSQGGPRGRGSPAPRRISPLAMASPSSPPLEDSGPSLNSSLHTSRFKFRSKLNIPLISAIVMVIFSEEEDELASSDDASRDQSPTQHASASESSLAEDVLKVSATVHEEDRQGEACTQMDSPQENIIACEPANRYESVLHLVPPPDGNLMEVEDGVMVTWERSSDKANDNATGESQQA